MSGESGHAPYPPEYMHPILFGMITRAALAQAGMPNTPPAVRDALLLLDGAVPLGLPSEREGAPLAFARTIAELLKMNEEVTEQWLSAVVSLGLTTSHLCHIHICAEERRREIEELNHLLLKTPSAEGTLDDAEEGA